MIQIAMLIALGFLLASLFALAFAAPLWRRAVRLTTKRLEATMPMSISDIQADKDQLRAEYAVKLRQLEQAYEREKEKAVRFLVDRNKSSVTHNTLKTEIEELKSALAEQTNKTGVLEQTIQKKIPELHGQLDRAGQIIATRDRELARMTTAYENQTEALGIAKKSVTSSSEEIERLRMVLEGGEAKGGKLRGDANEALVEQNHQLQADISRLRQKLAEAKEYTASDNAALRAELHRLTNQMMEHPDASSVDERASEQEEISSNESARPGHSGNNKADSEKTGKPARKNKSQSRSRTDSRKANPGSLAARLKKLTTKENV